MHVTSGVRSDWIGDRSKKLYRHTMEMEQMMARLPGEIKTGIRSNQAKTDYIQAKADAKLREMREEMRAGQELLKEEMLAKLDAPEKRMMARMDSQLEKIEAAVETNQEEVNDTDLETNPGKIESEVENEEVSKEEAAVKKIGALKERNGNRNVAVVCNRQMKKMDPGRW
jgi:hypothetical protein